MARSRTVQVKVNRVSINVATIAEAARRNTYITGRMETTYKRDIVPKIRDKVRDSYERLFWNFRFHTMRGIPQSSHVSFRYTFDGKEVKGKLDTGWDPLSEKTVKIKGHSNFWRHTGKLSNVLGGFENAALGVVKTTRSGIDLRRSRVNKKTGVAPLTLSTTVALPSTGSEIMDGMVVSNFKFGYGFGTSELFDIGGLSEVGGKIHANKNLEPLEYMALNELRRPFIQNLSKQLGEYLRRDLELSKLW